MGAQTAPAKPTARATLASASPTPAKAQAKLLGDVAAPDFQFTFKREPRSKAVDGREPG